MNASKMKCLMACSSHLNPKKGILPSHAYSVHSAYEVVTHKIQKLVKVRNPHGAGLWTGKWSPSQQKWSLPSVRDLGDRNDPGQFFIQFEDYLSMFDQTIICYEIRTNRKRQYCERAEQYSPEKLVG